MRLIAFLILLIPVIVYPTEYYVFETENSASSALNYINASSRFPIKGRNARTGELADGPGRTVKYCDEVRQRLDGKWVIPRIPADQRAILSAEESNAFINGFDFTIETYQNDWFEQGNDL